MRTSLLLLLVACVQDGRLNPKPDDGRDLDDTALPDTGDTGDTADTDTDTEPPACTLDLGPAGTVPVDAACAGTVTVEDPWDADPEWQYASGGQGVIVLPVVAQLTDDDGDGDTDADDLPDIVFTVLGANTLVALSGDGSGPLFEKRGFDGTTGVAVADVDADGDPEIVALTTDFHMAAVDATGRTEWTSPSNVWTSYSQPTVADLDGDGAVEILTESQILRGRDGGYLASLSGSTTYSTPVVADLDRDGTAEILTGGAAFAPDGTLLWSLDTFLVYMAFAAVGNLDADDDGEVVFVLDGEAHVRDADGAVLSAFPVEGGTRTGPPCIADVDGDGGVEIVVPDQNFVTAFTPGGTMVWQAEIRDGSGAAGCSAFDLDADGAAEVLIADEIALRIFDGRTGALRHEDYSHTSNTLWEYPVVADVDGDGAAEIVLADNNGDTVGITVWGHGGDGWAPAGPTWAVHDYAPGRVGDDGAVPAPSAPWLAWNGFRARPVDAPLARPDLVAEVTDTCVPDCAAGTAELAVAVANEGAVDAAAGAVVAVYADDGRLLTTLTLPAVASGERLAALPVTLDVADVRAGLRLVVDDDGTGGGVVDECDEDDNDAVLEALCP